MSSLRTALSATLTHTMAAMEFLPALEPESKTTYGKQTLMFFSRSDVT